MLNWPYGLTPSELSETQNCAYWEAKFCLGSHKFYNGGVLRMHVFLIGTCQNSAANGQIHTMGDQKPLILPRHAYRATGGVTHCQSVFTNHIIRLMCNMQFSDDD